MMDIDFVIPWVDGADPKWREKKNRYVSDERVSTFDAGEERYRDWGILHYWFRSIEKNTPWVRYIYLITDHQIPHFLKTDHPKLRLVFHEDYIPERYLPTFSSNTIELNLHLLPGLSKHFVYFNDDFYINKPVRPDFFFQKGRPCYAYIERPLTLRYPIPQFQHIQINDMAVLNRYFSKRTIQRHPGLGLNYRYKRHLLGNLLMLPWPNFQNLIDEHIPYPMLLSTLMDVWNTAGDILDKTCQNKFRAQDDVNQYLFRYWDLARGNFYPHCISPGFYNVSEACIDECERDIRYGLHTLIAVNDSQRAKDFDMLKKRIEIAFKARYPEKSSFE